MRKKYAAIVTALESSLASGDLAAGERVPSENELAARYAVSRPTAARALQELARAGLVERRAGSGPQAQPGQAQPALLVIGRALAGVDHLDQRVEQAARRRQRPLVAPGLDQLLELAGERRQQRGLAAERGPDPFAGLGQPRVGRRGAGVVGRGPARAHVEGQAPATGRVPQRLRGAGSELTRV